MGTEKLTKILFYLVRGYRITQFKRVHRFRGKAHTDKQKGITSGSSWDLPIVVVSCLSSTNHKVWGNGHNCSWLRNPTPVVKDAYDIILDNQMRPLGKSVPLGTKPNSELKALFGYSNESGYVAGRCAEPHAVHSLANKLIKKGYNLQLEDVVFSKALRVSDCSINPYCATCKIVFPQLRK